MYEKMKLLAKWRLHRFYSKHSGIAAYLPPTTMLNVKTLTRYLNDYGTVYVKASTQHQGRGVVKVWQADEGYRFVRVRGKINKAATVQELVQRIKSGNPKQTFIVQRAIDLAKVKGKVFDIRVMMMRDGERKWQYGGMVAKVAGQGSVVSNVQQGRGYVMSVDQALRQSLNYDEEQIERVKKELISLSRTIMKHSKSYPFFSFQCGIDLAVDTNGKVWIIEVNLHNPAHSLFKKLKNKTFYRRIGRLYWAYRKKHKKII
ncbi:YheC/YheD family protein [Paenibacillus cremeus]|nr:YheC/YheD family protein [Paenibacillus cremeus]